MSAHTLRAHTLLSTHPANHTAPWPPCSSHSTLITHLRARLWASALGSTHPHPHPLTALLSNPLLSSTPPPPPPLITRYDAAFASLKAVLRERDEEMSELRISAAELRHAAKAHQERSLDEAAAAERKLAAAREEADASRARAADEVKAARESAAEREAQLTGQIRDAHAATERGEREAATAAERAAAAREAEHASAIQRSGKSLQKPPPPPTPPPPTPPHPTPPAHPFVTVPFPPASDHTPNSNSAFEFPHSNSPF